MGETKMRWRTLLRTMAGVALLGAWAAGVARGDVDSERLALGFLTENADVVAVATVQSGLDETRDDTERAKVVYAVDEVLRGRIDTAELLVVLERDVQAGLHDAPSTHLLFLKRPVDGGPCAPLAGAAGVRPLPGTGPAARTPEIVARYAAALALPASQRAEALCEELVVQMEDEDPGIAWSGATDFFRHAELAASISQEHARRIVAAFRASVAGGRAQEMLALAVARCGDPDAADALADAIASDGAAAIKGGLGDAAEVLGSEELALELARRLEDAAPERRVPLVCALGRVGRSGAVDAVVPFVRDADPAVRQEALHACGNLARNVRRDARRERALGVRPAPTPDPDPEQPSRPEDDVVRPDEPVKPAEPDAPPTGDDGGWETARARLRLELSRAALRAESVNDKRGALWALAQLDDPAAYAFLRRLTEESEDDDVRRLAKSYLERPAQSLILR